MPECGRAAVITGSGLTFAGNSLTGDPRAACWGHSTASCATPVLPSNLPATALLEPTSWGVWWVKNYLTWIALKAALCIGNIWFETLNKEIQMKSSPSAVFLMCSLFVFQGRQISTSEFCHSAELCPSISSLSTSSHPHCISHQIRNILSLLSRVLRLRYSSIIGGFNTLSKDQKWV